MAELRRSTMPAYKRRRRAREAAAFMRGQVTEAQGARPNSEPPLCTVPDCAGAVLVQRLDREQPTVLCGLSSWAPAFNRSCAGPPGACVAKVSGGQLAAAEQEAAHG